MRILVQQKTEPISLTERIYRDLRLSIITGKLPGGTRLIESTLAREMGASRTPVREALQRLSQEELVYSIPRLGFIVEDMSEADIQDLFATRMEIELYRNDHRSIYNAFKSKDPKKIEATITDHLRVVKSDILDFLKRVREEEFLAQDI